MSNQVIEREPNGRFSPGSSGNIRGNALRTRHLFSKAFVEALLEDFREWGAEAIMRVRTETPSAYLRVCAMVLPKELKVEPSGGLQAMSDEELERGIELLEEMLAKHEAGANAKIVEGVAEPAALPGPRKPRRQTRKRDTRSARPRRAEEDVMP
jgi:hypothetical protein